MADDPQTPPADDEQPQDPPATAEDDDDAGDGDLPEAVKAQLKAARKSARDASAAARAAEQRAAAAEAALKDKNDAELSELERAQARAAEAEAAAEAAQASAKETALRYEVQVQANKLNLHDADTAYRLIDAADVTWGDDNRPTNVEALMKALVKERPFLARSKAEGGVDPTPGGNDKPPSDDEIRKQAGNRLARARL